MNCLYRHVGDANGQTAFQQSAGAVRERTHIGETQGSKSRTPNNSVIRKPVSQLQQTNPREFQIGQLVKRFPGTREDNEAYTVLTFILNPSDPDFPFELAGLHCTLSIPKNYPKDGVPTLRITNSEMPRGYQINVERGFEGLVRQGPAKTLLTLFNELDKNLEHFLKTEKAQTIKIIANAGKKADVSVSLNTRYLTPSPEPIRLAPPLPSWTNQQRSDALAQRQRDVRQLEARMGRLPGFSKTSDGILFTIPIKANLPGWLPVSLQSLKEIQLHVPKLYNLEPCTIHLKDVYGSDAERVEFAFERHAREELSMTLMAHINFLVQNIQTWATEPPLKNQESSEDVSNQKLPELQGHSSDPAPETPEDIRGTIPDHDRPHVRFIPRPVEWEEQDSDSDSDSGSYDSQDNTAESDQDDDDLNEAAGGASLPSALNNAAKGISLSFPNIELHGIELLILSTISLSLRCLRCKTQLEVLNIKPSDASSSSTTGSTISTLSTRNETCPKCSTPFTINYHPLPLHAHSVRAGTLDLTGCTVVDLLPSTFQPTCANCSTTFPTPPGMISVRGDTPIQVCRSCHMKMSFKFPEAKFLRLALETSSDLPLRKTKRENLGVTSGTPLALNGTCAHYAHSYRWFRFSCCGRVYPCDRCHDAAEPHVNDRAERMLCGWCSREQRFRPEDCGFCGKSVVRRRKAAGSGFWEGGRGTRDKEKMSRKEKRKYTHRKPAAEKKT